MDSHRDIIQLILWSK